MSSSASTSAPSTAPPDELQDLRAQVAQLKLKVEQSPPAAAAAGGAFECVFCRLLIQLPLSLASPLYLPTLTKISFSSLTVLVKLFAERDRVWADRNDRAQAERDRAQAERDRKLDKSLELLTRTLSAIGRAQMHSPSPSAVAYSTVGTEALSVLKRQGKVTVLAPALPSSPDSAPIVSSDVLKRLGVCATEAELVAAIAPALHRARGFADRAAEACAPMLVNSEAIRWLDALDAALPADQRKKPDLFATWTPFLAHSSSSSGSGIVPTGKLASRTLQLDGCVAEFYEAKVGSGSLTPADFGQLADYHSRVSGDVRGVLFNARYFWLYHSERHDPLSLVKGELGLPGSQAALRNFFADAREPPLLLLLRHLLTSLGAVPWTPPSAGGADMGAEEGPAAASGGGGGGAAPAAAATGFTTPFLTPFLGAGGSARVFAVQRQDSPLPCALKASLTLQRSELEFEYGLMKRAADAGAPVVAVVEGSLTFFYHEGSASYGGGGFLLRSVCKPAAVTSLTRCKAAFAALQQLHKAGFVHGDARLPNLVLGPARRAAGASEAAGGGGSGAGGSVGSSSEREMLWIDLREGVLDDLPVNQRADARALAASVLRARPGMDLPASVEEALESLELGGDNPSYAALGAAVWSQSALAW